MMRVDGCTKSERILLSICLLLFVLDAHDYNKRRRVYILYQRILSSSVFVYLMNVSKVVDFYQSWIILWAGQGRAGGSRRRNDSWTIAVVCFFLFLKWLLKNNSH